MVLHAAGMPATMHAPVRVRVSARATRVLLFVAILLTFASLFYISQSRVITATPFAGAQSVGGSVYLSPSAASAAASSTAEQPMFEMEVGNDGTTYLQGARVEAVSGNDITVSIAWGSASFLWTVQADAGTKFLDSNGNDESEANIVPGDYVDVTGQIDRLSQSPTIEAQYIHQS